MGTIAMEKSYPRGEEIAHAITHGLGLLLSVAGLVLLSVFAVLRGSAWHVVSCCIYGGTLVLLYTASTFYHALPCSRAKRVFQLLDHAAIYLLIAGTYTPFTLVSLHGGWGWTLFGLVWGLAVAGTLLELIRKRRLRRLSLALYLSLGWLVIIAVKPLLQALAPGGLLLLGLGGLAYSVGVIFYVWRRLPYHHAIWHVFVLAGSILHFFSILYYVIPPSA